MRIRTPVDDESLSDLLDRILNKGLFLVDMLALSETNFVRDGTGISVFSVETNTGAYASRGPRSPYRKSGSR